MNQPDPEDSHRGVPLPYQLDLLADEEQRAAFLDARRAAIVAAVQCLSPASGP
ncbi:hypothetical protein [Streptomyces sp. NPDC047990]|uniref:hypothetical protein n=1 Tax=Streptomyces sp. NPDC047990 TaxID=3365496 RepID=UPI00371E13ED